MGNIGIFRATFVSVHRGHILIAESALSQMALDMVIWVPNPRPHYKQAVVFEHRWEMVRFAIANHPGFTIFPNLAESSTSTYAIQTLIELQAAYPNNYWYWILGLDTFQSLPRWYRRHELAAACEWIVASRGNAEFQFTCTQVVQQLAAQSINIQWQTLDMPVVGVSASLIRQYCRSSRSIRYLVPESVRTYIATHNLYKEGLGAE